MALVHVNYFSEILGMSTQMEVILPQKKEHQIGGVGGNMPGPYPVLYLLHGMTDNHTLWQRNTSIERYALEKDIAVVMPNGHLSWYTDMKWGYRYGTHIGQELPEICCRFFPCISKRREDTYIAGNSMGGYGAFKIALSNPGRFTKAASLSGALDASSCAIRNKNRYGSSIWEDIFGKQEEIRGSRHDLFFLSEELSEEERPELYMWCGTEDALYDQNIQMKDHLQKLGYDLTYQESSGDHSWRCWDKQIQRVLDWMIPNERGM